MTLLSDSEKAVAAADVRELIGSSGQEAVLLRSQPGEKLYGSDDEPFAEIGTFKLEFVETPPEELSQKIDAAACVLPELDIRAQDRIRVGGDHYRVQTVSEELLFGVVTHKVLELVRLHGS